MARAIETFAPESFHKNTEEFIQPTLGSGVEIVVAWSERVIGTYHFHRQGQISVGTHPSCDIPVPLIHSFVDKMNLVQLNYGIQLNLPQGKKCTLGYFDQKDQFHTKNIEMGMGQLTLNQKELAEVYLSDELKLIIRPSQQPIDPKIIPFVDLSSDGFLSLAFAIVLTFAMALLVKLNPAPKAYDIDDEKYARPIILTNPERIAKILKPPQPPKVKIKVKDVVTKPKNIKSPKGGAKTKSDKTKVAGNKSKAGSLKKNPKPKAPKAGSTISKGKSIRDSKTQGGQAKSIRQNKPKLFAAIANFGRRSEIDTEYDGPGGLAGLANKYDGSAGENENRDGEKFGSKFRQAGSNLEGKNNVGVEGLTGGSGLGPGLGQQSLGGKKSVSIIPDGEGMSIEGEIDREGIRQVFFDNARAIRRCYEKSLNQDARLSGKMILNFDIGQQGRVVGRPSVSRGQSTFYNASMAQCLTNLLQGWRFPDPPNGQVVNVLYPLAFSSR
jgi:hypothetical protein